MTIDPAKRLADTLGLEALGNVAHEIPRSRWDADGTGAPDGRMFALMLDTPSTFDELVRRYAHSPEQTERILDNRFYRNIAGAMSGTQEYMAMEKLHELHEEGDYDLIVVDTPPTRHALDFLDAPERLTRLLDNRIFRILMAPTRTGLRVAGAALQAFFRTVAKVVGAEVIDDVVAFFRAFEGMEQGFRERGGDHDGAARGTDDRVRARHVATARRRPGSRVLRLAPRGVGTRGVGAGRQPRPSRLRRGSRRRPAERPRRGPGGARCNGSAGDARGDRPDGGPVRQPGRVRVAVEAGACAARRRGTRFGAAAVAFVPSLTHDVVDFQALDTVAAHLLGPGRTEPLG